MTDTERLFAEERHALIYKFLNTNGLPEDEFYDVVAFGYLRAVRRYHREKKLQKYSFNTIAWQAMRTETGNKRKADRIRDALIAYSLNDITEDGRELGEFVQSVKDGFRELEEQESLQELLAELMPALTDKQRGHIVATLEGYKAREVMQQQHESIQEYHQNNRAIKKTARQVLPASFRGGGGYSVCVGSITGNQETPKRNGRRPRKITCRRPGERPVLKA